MVSHFHFLDVSHVTFLPIFIIVENVLVNCSDKILRAMTTRVV